jgi:hypothetical protein
MISSPATQRKKPGYNPEKYPDVLKEKDFENATNLDKIHGFINWKLLLITLSLIK